MVLDFSNFHAHCEKLGSIQESSSGSYMKVLHLCFFTHSEKTKLERYTTKCIEILLNGIVIRLTESENVNYLSLSTTFLKKRSLEYSLIICNFVKSDTVKSHVKCAEQVLSVVLD